MAGSIPFGSTPLFAWERWRFNPSPAYHASLAQLVEQNFCKVQATSSSLVGGLGDTISVKKLNNNHRGISSAVEL